MSFTRSSDDNNNYLIHTSSVLPIKGYTPLTAKHCLAWKWLKNGQTKVCRSCFMVKKNTMQVPNSIKSKRCKLVTWVVP